MKRFFLPLILMLIVFIQFYSFAYAQVDTSVGAFREIESVLQKSPEEKALEEFNKMKVQAKIDPSTCDDAGESCCIVEVKLPKLPKINFHKELDIVAKSLDENESDPLSSTTNKFGMCNNDKVIYDFSHLLVEADNPDDVNTCRCVKVDDVRSLERLCKPFEVAGSAEYTKCTDCFRTQGVWSGLGCFKFSPAGFISTTLPQIGVGLAGIITLLCIIYSAFTLQISGGNPEKIKKAKERLTACIIGLLFILFSVFVLKLIGVDILQIPGLGG